MEVQNIMFAFALTLFAGLSESVGAVIGYLILFRFFNDVVFGVLFASVYLKDLN